MNEKSQTKTVVNITFFPSSFPSFNSMFTPRLTYLTLTVLMKTFEKF